MRVLGIDPGSEITGWGVVEGDAHGNHYRLVEFGVVRLKSSATFSSRLLKISRALAEVITRLKPDACAIEEAFLATNPKVTLKLGQVRGVALLAAESAALQIGEYSPRSIKQTVAGYGNAEKRQVQEMVRILLSLPTPPEPSDAADALAVAICHFHHASVTHRLAATEASTKNAGVAGATARQRAVR